MRYIREKHYDYALLIGIAVFLFSTYYLVPFFHELGHIIMLRILHCHYWSHLEYGFFYNFYGQIYEKCMLSEKEQIMVYLGGVGLTFFIGILLLSIEYYLHLKHRIERALPLLFLSYSFLLDFINYLFLKEGDLIEVLKILQREQYAYLLPIIGLLLITLLITYLYLDLNKEMLCVIEEESTLFKKIKRKIKKIINRE